jgi:pSer/pThr/pTyr-binding forkhead associated (FHA) protein
MITHLFGMGLGAAMAFAVAQSVYKPAWLKGIGGRLEGRTYTIPDPIAVIGCREDVNLFLPPDGTIAPVHAQVDSADDRHLIRAAMGVVSVNGKPIREHWLADNDVLELGTYRFRYRNRLGPVGAPAPAVASAPVVMPSAAPPTPVTSLGGLTLVDPMGGCHLLHPGKTVLGRDSGVEVSLNWEGTVSRRHAEISVGANGCTVTDLGSSNGTFVNDIAVATASPLKAGDELRLGRCVLKVR